jgi:hypothetical protein
MQSISEQIQIFLEVARGGLLASRAEHRHAARGAR